jgi:hypothetical protein
MSNEEDKNRLITMAEAAEIYGLTPQYLSRLAKKGRLRATLFGHSYVTTPADMEEFLLSREKKGFFREDIKLALD